MSENLIQERFASLCLLVPQQGPTVSAQVVNTTALWLNWTHTNESHLNGLFRGYKVLFRETENSMYTQYNAITLYGDTTSYKLAGLLVGRNYTIRVLTFSHNGDGFLSDSLYIATQEGLGEYLLFLLKGNGKNFFSC